MKPRKPNQYQWMRQESKRTWTKRKPKRVPYFRTSVTSCLTFTSKRHLFLCKLVLLRWTCERNKNKNNSRCVFLSERNPHLLLSVQCGISENQAKLLEGIPGVKISGQSGKKALLMMVLAFVQQTFLHFVASFTLHDTDWYRLWLCILMMCHCVLLLHCVLSFFWSCFPNLLLNFDHPKNIQGPATLPTAEIICL